MKHAGADGLAASYEYCRALHRTYGRTYYLATRLLPAWKRPHVHALYGFTRYTDEIVDAMDGQSVARRAARLRAWSDRFEAALDCAVDHPALPRMGAEHPALPRAAAGHAVLPAVVNTITLFGLDRSDFAAFLRSMEMDLTGTTYDTYDDLLAYMEGSAAAIGTMMLPILGTSDRALAREPARQLGLAFQLTNFIRDVLEDLERGRIYLPLKDLAEFGVTPGDLHARVATPAIRDLVAFEIRRAREHYARAAVGIPLLAARSRACIRTAHRLYGGILDEVERAGHDVFTRRAAVPTWRRMAGAAASLCPPRRPVSRRRGASA